MMLSPQPSPAVQAWEGSSAQRDPEALGQRRGLCGHLAW